MSLNIDYFKKFSAYPTAIGNQAIDQKTQANIWAQDPVNANIVREFKRYTDELAKENYIADRMANAEYIKLKDNDSLLPRLGKNVGNLAIQTVGSLGNAVNSAKSAIRNALGIGAYSKVTQMLKDHPELRYFSSGLDAYNYKGYAPSSEYVAQEAANRAKELQRDTYWEGAKGLGTGLGLALTGGSGAIIPRVANSFGSRALKLLGNNLIGKGLSKAINFGGETINDVGRYLVNPVAPLTDIFRSFSPWSGMSKLNRFLYPVFSVPWLPMGNNTSKGFENNPEFQKFVNENYYNVSNNPQDLRMLFDLWKSAR